MDAKLKAEIITQARKIVVQMGVNSLRMDDIAQAMRVSKRTLYETFGNKEELLYLAVKEHFDIFEGENAKLAKDTSNLLIAMMIVMEEIRKNAEVNFNIRASLRRFYPKIAKRLMDDNSDEKREAFANGIRKGIKDGYIEERVNVDLTINMFSYIAIGISENNEMLSIPKDMKISEAFHEVVVTYIRGISTIKGIKSIDAHLKQQNENNK